MRRICAMELVAVAQWENTRQHARGAITVGTGTNRDRLQGAVHNLN
jgi:hypothetical protein